MTEYRVLFDARGARYNLANRLFPEARAEEAKNLLERLELPERARWLDVGAGGGFLADRAAAQGASGAAFGCDESAVFLAGAPSYALRAACEFTRLPFPDGAFPRAASLAALHHAEAADRVLAEMLRVTAPGGRIVLGDVAAHSPAALFLNDFVDRHTETGHAGRFHAPDGMRTLLERAGGHDARADAVEISWRFPTCEDAGTFCRELFGLTSETRSSELDAALSALGLARDSGGWRLPWSMVFASAVRA
jgi:SAM-dependent methyltransferase